jgi:tetratricopeptide (TPR) repeat protein
VDYVLEGSVRAGGDRLRVTAQLIQVGDQTHLWAESYERELRDVLALESEVAMAIAGQIEARLGPGLRQGLRKPGARVDPVVFEHYLQGRYFETRGLEKSREYFEQVIRRDPAYAPAHAALARVYVVMGNWGSLPTNEALARARDAARRALVLDDGLPDAHLALAESTRDPALAEPAYLRALGLDPNGASAHQAYGLFLIGRKRF